MNTGRAGEGVEGMNVDPTYLFALLRVVKVIERYVGHCVECEAR